MHSGAKPELRWFDSGKGRHAHVLVAGALVRKTEWCGFDSHRAL